VISTFWPDAFCQGLASSGHRVIRFDHRDAGNSSRVDRMKRPYRLMDLVDDVVAILDACGVSAAHMAGNSMGGFIVQLAAIHHEDRLLRLSPDRGSSGCRAQVTCSSAR
jgi:pimeloyl-ACP methyl ester carboxylesterase